MKILRLQPQIDSPSRYNYQINYGVWDALSKIKDVTTVKLEGFNGDTTGFDIVLMPMFKRWTNTALLNKIKSQKARTIMFDNDCCYRSFSDEFYKGIDFVFYRLLDQNGCKPLFQDSRELLFSVNTDLYKPVYGGSGISFNCSVSNSYELRQQIAKIIRPTAYKGGEYIKHLQSSGAGIHTNSEISTVPRAKILEFASCGTEIISNPTEGMEKYFPDDFIIYFKSIEELKNIIDSYKPNIENQEILREYVVQYHSDIVRAKEVADTLKSVFAFN